MEYIGTYEVIGLLGSGITSDVFEVRKNNRTFAAKKSQEKAARAARNEISLLRAVSHPNIARVVDVVFEEHYTIIIEPKYNLSPRNNFDEEELFESMGIVMEAIIFLEREHIFLGDLHIGNIMWNYQDQPVLIDFGYNMRELEETFTGINTELARIYTLWMRWTKEIGKPKAEVRDLYKIPTIPRKFEGTKAEELILNLKNEKRLLFDIFKDFFSEMKTKGKSKLKYPYPLQRSMSFEVRKTLYNHFLEIQKTNMKSHYVEAIQLADRIYDIYDIGIKDLCTLTWNLLYGSEQLNQEVVIEVYKLLDLQIYSLTLWDFEKFPIIEDEDIEFMLTEKFPNLNFEDALNYYNG